jgi:uncharacterized membrane protein YfcA
MRPGRFTSLVWTVCLIAVGGALTFLTFHPTIDIAARFSGDLLLFVAIVALAFLGEYVDSSLGMGYGTTLTPVLLILGFTPLQVVPAVLLSEFATGIGSGLMHHRLGNVDLGRGTSARRTMSILAACSIVGTVLAVILAVNLPKSYVKAYIGVMITAIGLYILLRRASPDGFSLRRIIGLGTVAAFNKGISGGGYGPLVTGGQICAGVPAKQAVGICSFAEGLVCFAGLGVYLLLQGGPTWSLALPLTLGGILSVPAATWTVRLLPDDLLRRRVGYATLFLGGLTLVQIVL